MRPTYAKLRRNDERMDDMAGNMSIPEWKARNKGKKQASLGELMAQNKGKKSASIGGLKARNNGRDFENIIDITCRMYKKKGFGFIQKTPEPMSVIKNNGKGQFTSVFEKKAQPDYTGVLKGGTSIMFEAKHTEGTRFPFSRINDEQWEALETHHTYGGKSFVLLSFNKSSYYCVPFDAWMTIVKEGGKKSVNEKDLSGHRVSYKNGFVDFLGVL